MTQDISVANDLRAAAITRLRKKREFMQHLTAYVVVNLGLNLVWWLTMPGGFYWPAFPLFGWGIGLVFHALDVYLPAQPSEERIQREMNRLAHR
jgi:hypothetical protein